MCWGRVPVRNREGSDTPTPNKVAPQGHGCWWGLKTPCSQRQLRIHLSRGQSTSPDPYRVTRGDSEGSTHTGGLQGRRRAGSKARSSSTVGGGPWGEGYLVRPRATCRLKNPERQSGPRAARVLLPELRKHETHGERRVQ